MKRKHLALAIPMAASLFMSACAEEGRMSPEEEDVDIQDPGKEEDAEDIEKNETIKDQETEE
ncbi:hypothetical protein D3H55_02105 [Bacillus salacetis]|uniref:Lipoprotein n=1 Tax=Bacillus salacetis TaxID=2315464 RepID=A0A3A1R582_9BACI|nr:hypothetical protein [Bacillus salacetis]RIW38356.1 hypothetical protein D3H55_02105 [Bacillus salacetis]